MKFIENEFDFSGYEKDHFLFSDKNRKKRIGLMKDELNWKNNDRNYMFESKSIFL